MYIKTAPTCFGVTVNTIIKERINLCLLKLQFVKIVHFKNCNFSKHKLMLSPDDGVTVTPKHVEAVLM